MQGMNTEHMYRYVRDLARAAAGPLKRLPPAPSAVKDEASGPLRGP